VQASSVGPVSGPRLSSTLVSLRWTTERRAGLPALPNVRFDLRPAAHLSIPASALIFTPRRARGDDRSDHRVALSRTIARDLATSAEISSAWRPTIASSTPRPDGNRKGDASRIVPGRIGAAACSRRPHSQLPSGGNGYKQIPHWQRPVLCPAVTLGGCKYGARADYTGAYPYRPRIKKPRPGRRRQSGGRLGRAGPWWQQAYADAELNALATRLIRAQRPVSPAAWRVITAQAFSRSARSVSFRPLVLRCHAPAQRAVEYETARPPIRRTAPTLSRLVSSRFRARSLGRFAIDAAVSQAQAYEANLVSD